MRGAAPAAWAAGTRHFNLGAEDLDSHPGRLEERIAIEDLVHRYSWALDHLKRDLLESLFAPEAEFVTSFAGVEDAPIVGAGPIADALFSYMTKVVIQRRHFVTNLIVRHSGDREATALAYLLIVSGENTPSVIATGWYAMNVRKGDGWKIAFVYDGVDGQLPSDEWRTR